jgi:hypothetical protein
VISISQSKTLMSVDRLAGKHTTCIYVIRLISDSQSAQTSQVILKYKTLSSVSQENSLYD